LNDNGCPFARRCAEGPRHRLEPHRAAAGTTLRAVEDFARLELETDAAAMLIAQTETSDQRKLDEMVRACSHAGSAEGYVTQDEAEGQLLLNARRQALPALERLGSVLIDDIAVPLPALPEMFRRIEQIALSFSTMVATVAHAGDGNVHPLVVFERGNPDAPGVDVQRAHSAVVKGRLAASPLAESRTRGLAAVRHHSSPECAHCDALPARASALGERRP
jgi:FAD/FMN-containing dehydrogenase